MKRITFLFTLLVICCASFAQKNVVYKMVTDIPYTSSDDAYAKERCKLDVYYPTDKKNCQVVVGTTVAASKVATRRFLMN